ncbi:MAG: SMP-30/gluconolactonase/LRE family protein [Pyrinomonadaceae bacterium]|nr:SMP-30/gluconolactonase/LRE family protein [Pyrinomonadaceae bacterium]
MHTSFMVRALTNIALCVLLGISAVAHPGSGIVVDKEGQVFFTDTGQGVWKIDRQGNLTHLPASLFHWMTIDEAGYFAESQKSFGEWFERVTPQGSKPALIMSSDFPLTINRDGNLYYADTHPCSARIVRRTPDGKESVLAADEAFTGIAGIASGPDGSLYITNAIRPGANAIRKITMDGKVSQFASPETINIGGDHSITPPTESEASYCRGLAVDSQGIVYVAATGSRRVLKITPRGEVSTILQAPSPWAPTGVTVFGGEVYVLEWQDAPPSQAEVRRAWTPRVRKVGRDGKITTLATVTRETTASASPQVKQENSNVLSTGVKIAVAVVLALVVATIVGIKLAK